MAYTVCCIFVLAEQRTQKLDTVCKSVVTGKLLQFVFIPRLVPTSNRQDPVSAMRIGGLFPSANQIRQVLLWVKSAEIKQNLSVVGKCMSLQLRRLAQIRQINAIGNDADRVAHSVGADRLRFRFA